MKKIMGIVIAISIVSPIFAESAPKPRRLPPKGVAKPSGGIVEKSYSGNVLRVLNGQTAVPADKIAELTRKIRWMSLLPVEFAAGEALKDDCPIATANALVAQEKVGAGVLLVDDNKLPIMLTSPDSRWAILNVAALSADAPTPEKLLQRFTKVYWCAVARSLGVGNSGYQGCVLAPFTNVVELDRIAVVQPCPEPFNKMIDSAKAYGIGVLSIASYRTACQQGWAPTPTNDVQKAIWDEVHTLPSEPIKIKPESKKVTE